MTVSVYDRLDKTETGFVRAMARELIVARYGNHELVKTLPTPTGLRNGTKYPDV